MFSTFDDKEKYNDRVPTGQYFAKAYKQNSVTLQCHFAKEVKKQGAKTLSIDVSYKEAKHLCQYQGTPILKILMIGTNKVGKVRA